MSGHRAALWALALRPKKSCGPAQRLLTAALWMCVLPAASPAPGAQFLTPRTAGSPEGLVGGRQVVPREAEHPVPGAKPAARPESGARARTRPDAPDPGPHLNGQLGGGRNEARDALTCKRAE